MHSVCKSQVGRFSYQKVEDGDVLASRPYADNSSEGWGEDNIVGEM